MLPLKFIVSIFKKKNTSLVTMVTTLHNEYALLKLRLQVKCKDGDASKMKLQYPRHCKALSIFNVPFSLKPLEKYSATFPLNCKQAKRQYFSWSLNTREADKTALDSKNK